MQLFEDFRKMYDFGHNWSYEEYSAQQKTLRDIRRDMHKQREWRVELDRMKISNVGGKNRSFRKGIVVLRPDFTSEISRGPDRRNGNLGCKVCCLYELTGSQERGLQNKYQGFAPWSDVRAVLKMDPLKRRHDFASRFDVRAQQRLCPWESGWYTHLSG